MDSPSIQLPSAPAEARRPPVPFIAALVPVAAGVVLWLVTGSILSLCFAALGPLMIFASLIDGARSRRRAREVTERETEQAWAKAETELSARHKEEHARRWHRSPDAAGCLTQAPLRGLHGPDATTELVVGRGSAPSGIRASGGDGERARAFQARCGSLADAPITVPLGGGIALRGEGPIAAAAIRAVVVQLCLRFSPAQLALEGDALHEWGLDGFPQARAGRRGVFRLAAARNDRPLPDAHALLLALGRDDDVPEGITTVIDVVEPARAKLRTVHGISEVSVECVSHAQALVTAGLQSEVHDRTDVLPDALALSELDQVGSPTSLPAAIGRGSHGDVIVDIVDDGPHAIVTGTTGTGKSELLVTWVTAIALQHGPERVTFVLADFKGGTAFEPLRSLPQVAAVITDLDDIGARRGVSSLSAELRRRESVLAAAGARDVSEVDMPRLIIVIDEFAALLHEHADLGAIFTDIAARGRALGMHLIIGTQRASGVIRDALAANCPLRLSLRVSDASDSRLVIGTDDAAEVPGGAASRGLAFVRRPQDALPAAMRVALTGAADLRRTGIRWAEAPVPTSPWLPTLPALLPIEELLGGASDGTVFLGRADEPEHQRQPLELIRLGMDRGLAVLGAPGSGRTSLLRALQHQHPDALWLPDDAEGAWDAIMAMTEGSGETASLVLCDNIDSLISDLPIDYGQHLTQRCEQLLRGASSTTFVVTAARPVGAVGRLLDVLPRRALLRMSSRVDHLAAGGDAAGYDRDRPPGRMRIGDREVQVAWVSQKQQSRAADATEVPVWTPRSALTALVTTGARAVAEAMSSAHPECDVMLAAGEGVALPSSTRPTLVVGEADVWQRSWSAWQRIRREGEVLIRPEHPGDLRQLAGIRDVPPFARLHAGRAWSLTGDHAPRRLRVPALHPSR